MVKSFHRGASICHVIYSRDEHFVVVVDGGGTVRAFLTNTNVRYENMPSVGTERK